MKFKHNGFTIVELLIVISILAVVGIFVFRGFTSCSSSKGTAEVEGRKYAESLGLEVKGISCMNQDTDGDGYVSCSVSHLEQGKIYIIPIECAARWSRNNDGCKAQKVISQYGKSL